MRSQNAGRGGLLHVGYPHQGTVNDGIAVREGLFAVAATREHFSLLSRTGGMFPSRMRACPTCDWAGRTRT